MTDRKRYDLVDTLRGLSVISMIGFHACWIMCYFGLLITRETLFGPYFTAWERSICISFITIAGFSFSYGRRHLRSGIMLTVLGILITAVTCIFIPEIRIVFGILTFLGAATLIMIPVDKAYMNKDRARAVSAVMLVICLILFLATYNINKGFLGFLPYTVMLPQSLYKGLPAIFLGFTEKGFFSTDYFSILPWIFLYFCGYFLNKILMDTYVERSILTFGIPGIKTVGRHSLLIYIIHPVVLFVLVFLVSRIV